MPAADAGVVTIPLRCMCGHVGNIAYMRWCSCCGEAICPDCYPGTPSDGLLDKCKLCIAEQRPRALELAGRRAAAQREQAFFRKFFGTDYILPRFADWQEVTPGAHAAMGGALQDADEPTIVEACREAVDSPG